jgi:hemerythrin-like metal-binding protein
MDMTRTQVQQEAPPTSQYIASSGGGCSVHSEELDRQHDTLVLLMSELVCRDVEGADKQDQAALLDQLCTFTQEHFQAEEAYMRATGYDRLDIHGLIHTKLIAKLREHMQVFRSGSGRLGLNLLTFFEFWLAAHMNGADQHYARHVASQKEHAPGAR